MENQRVVQGGRAVRLTPQDSAGEALARQAVEAMAAAREALEALAAHRHRGRRDRLYWQELQADSAAVARLIGLHEVELRAQLFWG